MTGITASTATIQQEISAMIDGVLWVHFCFARAGESKWPEISAVECMGLIAQERIRRHALACQDLECGFSPIG